MGVSLAKGLLPSHDKLVGIGLDDAEREGEDSFGSHPPSVFTTRTCGWKVVSSVL